MSKSKEISYWAGTGKYQDVQKVLWDKLVPKSGEASTNHGELVRACGRLVYEHGNNGNCNARYDYGRLSPMYEEFLNLIEREVPNSSAEVNTIRDFIMHESCRFSQREMDKYNRLVDKVLAYLVEEREIDLDEYKLLAIEIDIKERMSTASFYRDRGNENAMKAEVLRQTGGDKEEIAKLIERSQHNFGTVNEYEAKATILRTKYIEEAVRQHNEKAEVAK